jgi:hypothetical protein
MGIVQRMEVKWRRILPPRLPIKGVVAITITIAATLPRDQYQYQSNQAPTSVLGLCPEQESRQLLWIMLKVLWKLHRAHLMWSQQVDVHCLKVKKQKLRLLEEVSGRCPRIMGGLGTKLHFEGVTALQILTISIRDPGAAQL